MVQDPKLGRRPSPSLHGEGRAVGVRETLYFTVFVSLQVPACGCSWAGGLPVAVGASWQAHAGWVCAGEPKSTIKVSNFLIPASTRASGGIIHKTEAAALTLRGEGLVLVCR